MRNWTPTLGETGATGQRGLRIGVLRRADGSDFTNGGISSRHAELTVVGVIDDRTRDRVVTPLTGDDCPHAVTEAAPAVWLHVRRIGGDVYTIVPAGLGGDAPIGITGTYMAGGNYAALVDSRFTELTGGMHGALSVHDRTERR